MNRVLLVVFAPLIASCAATGPLYQEPPPPPDGYAQVVIYRVSSIASGAHSSPFEIDKQHVADLNIDGYTRFLVRAGGHTLHCGGRDIPLDAQSGATYYFRYKVSPGLPFL